MALLDSEVQRIRFELGYNVMAVTAEPWIGVTQLFEQVVQLYTKAGATTTCSTAVTAVAAGASPAVVSLTLASATGFSVGDTVLVDVALPDDSSSIIQERTAVRTVAAPIITCPLSLAHSGTYPVTVEGGESIIREILTRCRVLGRKLFDGVDRYGVKRADDVEFFPGHSGPGFEVTKQLRYWREELASAIGCEMGPGRRGGGGGGGSIALR